MEEEPFIEHVSAISPIDDSIENQPRKPSPRHRKQIGRKAMEVTSVTPDRDVWQQALELARGDVSRLEIVGETDIIVHNDNSWRHKKNMKH